MFKDGTCHEDEVQRSISEILLNSLAKRTLIWEINFVLEISWMNVCVYDVAGGELVCAFAELPAMVDIHGVNWSFYTNVILYLPHISATLPISGLPSGKFESSSNIFSNPDGKILSETLAFSVPITFQEWGIPRGQ